MAAAASCFVTTFRAIAEFSKFEAAALEISVEGVVEKGDEKRDSGDPAFSRE